MWVSGCGCTRGDVAEKTKPSRHTKKRIPPENGWRKTYNCSQGQTWGTCPCFITKFTEYIFQRTVQDALFLIYVPACPAQGLCGEKQGEGRKRTAEERSSGVLCCSNSRAGCVVAGGGHFPFSPRQSLQCRWPSRLCLCGHVDGLRY